MTVERVLRGLKGTMHVSIRKRDRIYGMTYIGGGTCERCIYRYGAYIIEESCIIDGVLVLYVN